MLAPKPPANLVDIIGIGMHEFLTQQLETILEGEQEASSGAQAFFARGMEQLQKKGIEQQYIDYYASLLEVVYHGRKFLDSPAGKRMLYGSNPYKQYEE